jgi:hypothetical protein
MRRSALIVDTVPDPAVRPTIEVHREAPQGARIVVEPWRS